MSDREKEQEIQKSQDSKGGKPSWLKPAPKKPGDDRIDKGKPTDKDTFGEGQETVE